jgi:membrane protease YdiL (CAAX protease family)
MKNPVFLYLSPWGRLFLIAGLVLLFGILFSFLGLLIGKMYLGMSLTELATALSHPKGEVLSFALFYQFLNQIGIFIFPPLLYAFLVSGSVKDHFRLNRYPTGAALIIIFLSVYTVLPFLNYLSQVNQNIHFPDFMRGIEEWMRNKEEQAKVLTETFLKTKTVSGLMVNMLIMALIPAFGEELLFRGVIQKIFINMTKSSHWGIIITAALFSAFHFQFLGFLPRFLLGLMLGYAMVMTGSLWSAVWLHFVNNASTVLVYYLHYTHVLKFSADEMGNTPNPVYIWGSLLMTLWLFTMLYNREGADIRLKYYDRE